MTPMLIDGKPWESATGDVPGSATVRGPSYPSLLDDLMSGGPAAIRPAVAAPATVLMPQAGPPTFSHDTRNDRPRLDDLIPVNLGPLSPDETDAEWLRVNPHAIAAPPPPAGLRLLNRNRPSPGGGTRRGSSCKSKKGVRKSASGKRCRRKGKRSRRARMLTR